MDTEQHGTSILMLPWLAYGHISPFLELAKKLSQNNFHIYLCSTPINLESIRQNLHDKLFSSIQLIDIQLPYLAELPAHYHTTKGLPPHLKTTLRTAFDAAKPAFCNILKSLKPNLVIYDFVLPWAPIAAREQNIEAIVFLTCSAATCSFLTHYSNNPGCIEYSFPEFNFPETEFQKITQFMHYTANGITIKERLMECIGRSSNIVLTKTSREIEAKYIDYLSLLVGKEMVPVGPLVRDPTNKDEAAVIIEWLSKKDPSSVVFVSFGSEYFLSKEEMEEMANGLELSNVNFIWVVRFPNGEKYKVHEALPEGFFERIGEKGMVVEGWAPQEKILEHSSIGGFVSHCGWNSTLEGIMFGVPIIAMPMQVDQPWNAKLVVEIGMGMEVQRKNERFNREELARVIKMVVVQEEGKELKRKAKELSQKMRDKGDEEMDVVVKKLAQPVGESRTSAASKEI